MAFPNQGLALIVDGLPLLILLKLDLAIKAQAWHVVDCRCKPELSQIRLEMNLLINNKILNEVQLCNREVVSAIMQA